MTRISRSRMDMEDGRADNAFLKDYGETIDRMFEPYILGIYEHENHLQH